MSNEKYEITEWKISKKNVNDILKLLKQERDNEAAGSITFDDETISENYNVRLGNTVSVETPNTIFNFHTHPIGAYVENEAIYGHPSGEDIRESIRFSLNGNICHIVFTIEGLYTLQIQPVFIKWLTTLKPSERGFIISCIETFFRQFHIKRTLQYVEKYGINNYNPFVFIDITNTCTLRKILEYIYDNITSLSYGHINTKGNYKRCEFTKLNKKLLRNIISSFFDKKIKYDIDKPFLFMILYVADNVFKLKNPRERWNKIKNNEIDLTYSEDDVVIRSYNVKSNSLKKSRKMLLSLQNVTLTK